MKTKSLRFFREKYMTDVRCIKHVDEYDIQYIGGLKKLPSNIVAKGFFDLSHGDKENVDGFLSNFLKIAEDNQAIYEFLQNAADCGSTLFYLFYDEDYFLAVNNGVVFNKSGLRSILNVAQSDKHDSENIGRFGIGFKLVHRLVGVGDGLEELTKEYKGPILFSWNRKEDLLELMKGEKVEPVNEISDESPLPYLCKLIITNFPAEVGEVGKDLDYNERIFFTQEEYMELSEQVNKTLSPYLSTDNFNHGSLFFIKLGKGKKEKLDVDYNQNLKTGIEYSLNTLRKLSNVKINGSQIIKVPLILQSNTVEKGTDTFNNINPEYKDYDIHYVIGYNEIDFNAENPFINVDALKKSPTFYKYFPLGDEIHQSAIFIHSDSLSNETNRRKLHEDTTNKYLLSEIAGFIINNLEHFKKEGKDYDFLQLYANLLLCDKPHDNSIWLKSVLYDIILEYLTNCIPTDDGYANCAQNVKIKNVSCSVPLSVVNKDYEWFRWNGLNVKILVDAAKDKLSLDVYDIIDIIENSNVEELNKWILTTDGNSYESFLNEINSSTKILGDQDDSAAKLPQIVEKGEYGTIRLTGTGIYTLGPVDWACPVVNELANGIRLAKAGRYFFKGYSGPGGFRLDQVAELGVREVCLGSGNGVQPTELSVLLKPGVPVTEGCSLAPVLLNSSSSKLIRFSGSYTGAGYGALTVEGGVEFLKGSSWPQDVVLQGGYEATLAGAGILLVLRLKVLKRRQE